MDDLCMIIHTCDKYEFCWYGWYEYFKLNWNHNIKLDIYFVNENKDVNYKELIQFKTGSGEWSDRLIYTLKNLNYKYIFYIQEDMWIQKSINLEYYYNEFLKYDMNALRFINNGFEKSLYKYEEGLFFDNQFLKFDISNQYLHTHQPSIWKKDFFISCLEPNETPWKNEINGSIRLQNKNEDPKFYTINDLPIWYTMVSRKGIMKHIGYELLAKLEKNKK